jgi:hypothetical protein
MERMASVLVALTTACWSLAMLLIGWALGSRRRQ